MSVEDKPEMAQDAMEPQLDEEIDPWETSSDGGSFKAFAKIVRMANEAARERTRCTRCWSSPRGSTVRPAGHPTFHSADGDSRSLGEQLLAKYGNGERLLIPDEVAEIFQLAPESLSRWRQNGEGPRFVKFGRGRTAPIRYRLTDVLDHIERSVRRSTCDPGPA